MKHSEGNWKTGRGNVVVTDVVHATENDKKTGHYVPSEPDYYGGLLICESVRTPADCELIAAAPKLLSMLLQVKNAISSGTQGKTTQEHTSYTQTFGQAFLDEIEKITNPLIN